MERQMQTNSPLSTAGPPFEPRIIAFLCNGDTYTGADLAGPPGCNIRPTSASFG